MVDPKFLVVRYAHGAGGKFLCTMLQSSPDVACWDDNLQTNKNQKNFVEYTQQRFADDPSWHQRYEPDVCYTTDLYSGTFNRGNDLTLQDFVSSQQNDRFSTDLESNLWMNLILHKSEVPNFMQGSTVVNIILDTDRSVQWAKQMYWLKHYQVIDATHVRVLADDPSRINPHREHIARKYNNPCVLAVENIDKFKIEKVDSHYFWKLFRDGSQIVSHASNAQCRQVNWSLDSIFDRDQFVTSLERLTADIGISMPDKGLVCECYDVYWKKQQKHLEA